MAHQTWLRRRREHLIRSHVLLLVLIAADYLSIGEAGVRRLDMLSLESE
jgi:hypothetical protein